MSDLKFNPDGTWQIVGDGGVEFDSSTIDPYSTGARASYTPAPPSSFEGRLAAYKEAQPWYYENPLWRGMEASARGEAGGYSEVGGWVGVPGAEGWARGQEEKIQEIPMHRFWGPESTIKGASDLGGATLESVGQFIGGWGPHLLLGWVTGGTSLLGTVGTKVPGLLSKGVKAQRALNIATGSMAVSATGRSGREQEEHFGEINYPLAIAGGIGTAALERVGIETAVAGILRAPRGAEIWKRLLRGTAAGGVGEGLTEGAQEAYQLGINELASYVADKTYPLLTEDNGYRILNAATAGALGGGVITGAGSAMRASGDPDVKEVEEIVASETARATAATSMGGEVVRQLELLLADPEGVLSQEEFDGYKKIRSIVDGITFEEKEAVVKSMDSLLERASVRVMSSPSGDEDEALKEVDEIDEITEEARKLSEAARKTAGVPPVPTETDIAIELSRNQQAQNFINEAELGEALPETLAPYRSENSDINYRVGQRYTHRTEAGEAVGTIQKIAGGKPTFATSDDGYVLIDTFDNDTKSFFRVEEIKLATEFYIKRKFKDEPEREVVSVPGLGKSLAQAKVEQQVKEQKNKEIEDAAGATIQGRKRATPAELAVKQRGPGIPAGMKIPAALEPTARRERKVTKVTRRERKPLLPRRKVGVVRITEPKSTKELKKNLKDAVQSVLTARKSRKSTQQGLKDRGNAERALRRRLKEENYGPLLINETITAYFSRKDPAEHRKRKELDDAAELKASNLVRGRRKPGKVVEVLTKEEKAEIAAEPWVPGADIKKGEALAVKVAAEEKAAEEKAAALAAKEKAEVTDEPVKGEPPVKEKTTTRRPGTGRRETTRRARGAVGTAVTTKGKGKGVETKKQARRERIKRGEATVARELARIKAIKGNILNKTGTHKMITTGFEIINWTEVRDLITSLAKVLVAKFQLTIDRYIDKQIKKGEIRDIVEGEFGREIGLHNQDIVDGFKLNHEQISAIKKGLYDYVNKVMFRAGGKDNLITKAGMQNLNNHDPDGAEVVFGRTTAKVIEGIVVKGLAGVEEVTRVLPVTDRAQREENLRKLVEGAINHIKSVYQFPHSTEDLEHLGLGKLYPIVNENLLKRQRETAYLIDRRKLMSAGSGEIQQMLTNGTNEVEAVLTFSMYNRKPAIKIQAQDNNGNLYPAYQLDDDIVKGFLTVTEKAGVLSTTGTKEPYGLLQKGQNQNKKEVNAFAFLPESAIWGSDREFNSSNWKALKTKGAYRFVKDRPFLELSLKEFRRQLSIELKQSGHGALSKYPGLADKSGKHPLLINHEFISGLVKFGRETGALQDLKKDKRQIGSMTTEELAVQVPLALKRLASTAKKDYEKALERAAKIIDSQMAVNKGKRHGETIVEFVDREYQRDAEFISIVRNGETLKGVELSEEKYNNTYELFEYYVGRLEARNKVKHDTQNERFEKNARDALEVIRTGTHKELKELEEKKLDVGAIYRKFIFPGLTKEFVGNSNRLLSLSEESNDYGKAEVAVLNQAYTIYGHNILEASKEFKRERPSDKLETVGTLGKADDPGLSGMPHRYEPLTDEEHQAMMSNWDAPASPRESDRLVIERQDTQPQREIKTELGRLQKDYYDISNNPEANTVEIEDALARLVKGELVFSELVGKRKPDVSLAEAGEKFKAGLKGDVQNKLKRYGAGSNFMFEREQKMAAFDNLFEKLGTLFTIRSNKPDVLNRKVPKDEWTDVEKHEVEVFEGAISELKELTGLFGLAESRMPEEIRKYINNIFPNPLSPEEKDQIYLTLGQGLLDPDDESKKYYTVSNVKALYAAEERAAKKKKQPGDKILLNRLLSLRSTQTTGEKASTPYGVLKEVLKFGTKKEFNSARKFMQAKFATLLRTRGSSSRTEPLQLFTHMLKLSADFNEQYITQQLIEQEAGIEERDERDPKTGNRLEVSPEGLHLSLSETFEDGDEIVKHQFNAVTLWLKLKAVLESNGDPEKFLTSPAWLDDPRITEDVLKQMKKDARRVLKDEVNSAEQEEKRQKVTNKENPRYGEYVRIAGGLKPRANAAEFRSPTLAKGKETYERRLKAYKEAVKGIKEFYSVDRQLRRKLIATLITDTTELFTHYADVDKMFIKEISKIDVNDIVNDGSIALDAAIEESDGFYGTGRGPLVKLGSMNKVIELVGKEDTITGTLPRKFLATISRHDELSQISKQAHMLMQIPSIGVTTDRGPTPSRYRQEQKYKMFAGEEAPSFISTSPTVPVAKAKGARDIRDLIEDYRGVMPEEMVAEAYALLDAIPEKYFDDMELGFVFDRDTDQMKTVGSFDEVLNIAQVNIHAASFQKINEKIDGIDRISHELSHGLFQFLPQEYKNQIREIRIKALYGLKLGLGSTAEQEFAEAVLDAKDIDGNPLNADLDSVDYVNVRNDLFPGATRLTEAYRSAFDSVYQYVNDSEFFAHLMASKGELLNTAYSITPDERNVFRKAWDWAIDFFERHFLKKLLNRGQVTESLHDEILRRFKEGGFKLDTRARIIKPRKLAKFEFVADVERGMGVEYLEGRNVEAGNRLVMEASAPSKLLAELINDVLLELSQEERYSSILLDKEGNLDPNSKVAIMTQFKRVSEINSFLEKHESVLNGHLVSPKDYLELSEQKDKLPGGVWQQVSRNMGLGMRYFVEGFQKKKKERDALDSDKSKEEIGKLLKAASTNYFSADDARTSAAEVRARIAELFRASKDDAKHVEVSEFLVEMGFSLSELDNQLNKNTLDRLPVHIEKVYEILNADPRGRALLYSGKKLIMDETGFDESRGVSKPKSIKDVSEDLKNKVLDGELTPKEALAKAIERWETAEAKKPYNFESLDDIAFSKLDAAGMKLVKGSWKDMKTLYEKILKEGLYREVPDRRPEKKKIQEEFEEAERINLENKAKGKITESQHKARLKVIKKDRKERLAVIKGQEDLLKRSLGERDLGFGPSLDPMDGVACWQLYNLHEISRQQEGIADEINMDALRDFDGYKKDILRMVQAEEITDVQALDRLLGDLKGKVKKHTLSAKMFISNQQKLRSKARELTNLDLSVEVLGKVIGHEDFIKARNMANQVTGMRPDSEIRYSESSIILPNPDGSTRDVNIRTETKQGLVDQMKEIDEYLTDLDAWILKEGKDHELYTFWKEMKDHVTSLLTSNTMRSGLVNEKFGSFGVEALLKGVTKTAMIPWENFLANIGTYGSKLAKKNLYNLVEGSERAELWRAEYGEGIIKRLFDATKSHGLDVGREAPFAVREWYDKVGRRYFSLANKPGRLIKVGGIINRHLAVPTITKEDFEVLRYQSEKINKLYEINLRETRGPAAQARKTEDVTRGGQKVFRAPLKDTQHTLPKTISDMGYSVSKDLRAMTDSLYDFFIKIDESGINERQARLAKLALLQEPMLRGSSIQDVIGEHFDTLVYAFLDDRSGKITGPGNPYFKIETVYSDARDKVESGDITDMNELAAFFAARSVDMNALDPESETDHTLTKDEALYELLREIGKQAVSFSTKVVNRKGDEKDVRVTIDLWRSKNSFTFGRQEAVANWFYYDHGISETPGLSSLVTSSYTQQLDEFSHSLSVMEAELENASASKRALEGTRGETKAARNKWNKDKLDGKNYFTYEKIEQQKADLEIMRRMLQEVQERENRYDIISNSKKMRLALGDTVGATLLGVVTGVKNLVGTPLRTTMRLQAIFGMTPRIHVMGALNLLKAMTSTAATLSIGMLKGSVAAVTSGGLFNKRFAAFLDKALNEVWAKELAIGQFKINKTYAMLTEAGYGIKRDIGGAADNYWRSLETRGRIDQRDELTRRSKVGHLIMKGWGAAAFYGINVFGNAFPRVFDMTGNNASFSQVGFVSNHLEMRLKVLHKINNSLNPEDRIDFSTMKGALSPTQVFGDGFLFSPSPAKLKLLEDLFLQSGLDFHQEATRFLAKLDDDRNATFLDSEQLSKLGISLFQENASTIASRPLEMKNNPDKSAIWSLMGWATSAFHNTNTWASKAGSGRSGFYLDNPKAHQLLVLAGFMVIGAPAGVGQDEFLRWLRKFLHGELRAGRLPYEEDTTRRELVSWVRYSMMAMPFLNMPLNLLFSDQGGVAANGMDMFVQSRIKQVSSYFAGVGFSTRWKDDPLTGMFYNIDFLLKSLYPNPLAREAINDIWQGYMKVTNNKRMIQRHAPADYRKPIGMWYSGASATPITPYIKNMVHYSAMADWDNFYREANKAIDYARKSNKDNPTTYVRGLFWRRNPYTTALRGTMSPGVRREIIDGIEKHMGEDWLRQFKQTEENFNMGYRKLGGTPNKFGGGTVRYTPRSQPRIYIGPSPYAKGSEFVGGRHNVDWKGGQIRRSRPF